MTSQNHSQSIQDSIEMKHLSEPLIQKSLNVSSSDKIKSEGCEPEIGTEKLGKYDSLTECQFWGYGVGHFLNDLTASCWFNYLLYFYVEVQHIDDDNPGKWAGLVMLAAQITDAIFTPLVGYCSDKYESPKLGKRKFWYIIGFSLQWSFLLIFQPCLFCSWTGNNSFGMRFFFALLFPCLFNVAWAFVQVSHMSLAPRLSCSRSRRDRLSNLRNTFTYISQLLVLNIAFLYFYFANIKTKWWPFYYFRAPLFQFQMLSYTTVFIGGCTSLIFIMTINEPKLSQECKVKQKACQRQKDDDDEEIQEIEDTIKHEKEEKEKTKHLLTSKNNLEQHEEGMELKERLLTNEDSICPEEEEKEKDTSIMFWFKQWMFFQYGFVYMGARMLNNISNSMLQFYLVYVIRVNGDTKTGTSSGTSLYLAIFPLIGYLSSVFTSSQMDWIGKAHGRKKVFTGGVIVQIFASILLMYVSQTSMLLMYPTVILMGCAQSIALNTSINLIGEVVGLRADQGAVVYGFYSLFEKLANGFILYYVMSSVQFDDKEEIFIRLVTSVIPLFATIMAWVLVLVGKAKDYVDAEGKAVSDFVSQS